MSQLSKSAFVLCIVGAAIGVVGLTTHLAGVPGWTSVFAGRPMMMLVTSVALTVAGLAAAPRTRIDAPRSWVVASKAGGVLVLTTGTLTVLEHAFDVSLGIDWTLPGSTSAGFPAGRPSPLTGAANIALGSALVLFDTASNRRVRTREWFALAAAFFVFIALVGHAFGASPMYRIAHAPMIGVSVPTGLGLLTIALGILFARPDEGLMRLVTSRAPAGVIVRRLGLAAIVGGPLLAIALRSAVGEKALIDLPLALAIGVVLSVALSLSMVAVTAIPLADAHDKLDRARDRLFQLLEQAPDGVFVANLEGRYVEVNEAACRMFGYAREELVGKTILDLIRPEEAARLWADRDALLRGGTVVSDWMMRRKDGTMAPFEVSTRILADGRWQAFVRDISDRVALQREVVRSRDLLQRVLESATSYGIVADDLDGHIVLWNEGARRVFGYTETEVLGATSEALLAPANPDAYRSLRALGLEVGTAEGSFRGRKNDGSEFEVQAVFTRRVDEAACPAGVVIVAHDLTDEKRRLGEQALLARAGEQLANCLEVNEVLRTVAQLATDHWGDRCVIDLVEDGALVRAITRHRDASGGDVAAPLVRTRPSTAPSDAMKHVLETKTASISDDPRALDGSLAPEPSEGRTNAPFPVSTMLVPMIARGNLVAVLGIASTVPERRHGADELRVAEELARRAALALDNVHLYQQSRLQGAVTTNLAEGVVVIRQRDAMIVYANPRFEAMLEYAPNELVGRPVSTINAPGDRSPEETAQQIIEELARSGAWHGEIANRTKQDRIVWCYASVASFDHVEHGPVWISVHMDITERKALELANEHALREKEALLREVHHRVRNNLQVISSLFSLQRSSTTSEELRTLLDESRNRVQSIALVHELLYRSTNLAEIDFHEYLPELVGSIRAAYGRPEIGLDIDARGVRLDAERAVPCALIVGELVANAFKHAFPDRAGTIAVHARREASDDFVLEVSDDGRGMPPTTDSKPARSLGLRLVAIFTQQLGGTFTTDRTRGTRFVIRFPADKRRKSSPPTGSALASPEAAASTSGPERG